MAKRVYTETVKKWLIGAGITVGTLIGGLFLYLIFLGAIDITGYSGDVVCAGTEEDPCYAYINLTAKEDIFIYPIGYDPWGRDTIIEFNPAVKSWKLQRSWGSGWRDIPLDKTCTGKWCGAPDNQGVSYSYVFREGKKYQLRIVGYKNSPYEDVKWSIDYENKEYLDPVWKGIKKKKAQNSVLATIPKSESIRVTDQSGFDENFDWNFKKINENQWLATFKIKVPIYENIKECEEIQSEEDKLSCAKQKAKEIFGKEKEEEYGKAISKLSEYPEQELTENIRVSNIKFDKETGEGDYILDFPEGFEDGEIIRIGFNSTTILTSTTDPFIGWESSNRYQYSCRGDNSRIHVIFQNPAEKVYYAYSDDNGYTWNNSVNFTGAVDMYDMAIDCYDENITIAYSDQSGTDRMIVNFSTDNGDTWSGMPDVSDSNVYGPRCIQRASDIVCVYGENTGDEYNLCYSTNKSGWESCHSIYDCGSCQTFLNEIVYYPDEWWHADADGIIAHLRYGGGDNMHIHQGNYTNTNFTELSDTLGGDSWTIVGDPDRPGVLYISEDDDGSTDAWFYYSMDNGTTITGEGKVADDCQYAFGQIRDETGGTRASVEIFCVTWPGEDIVSYTYDGETTITGPTTRYEAVGDVQERLVASNVDGRNSNNYIDLLYADLISGSYDVMWLSYHFNDSVVPEFYDYWDDSYNLTSSGIGYFNVTINNTNGTVFLYVNNTAIQATNLTEKVYNASYNFTASGTYQYYWYSWGTGPNNNYAQSDNRNYVVNSYYEFSILDPTTGSPKSVTYPENITLIFKLLKDGSNVTSGVGINNITIGGVQADVVEGSGGVPFEYYDDFETDFGHWAVHQGINCPDADAWGDRGTSTPSGSTGPQSGGVGGAGTYFIFVEASSGNCYDTGDIALVYFNTTLDYDASSEEKIEFYFDAYGATIDDLYLEENSTGSWVKLWEMHDINNDYWNFTSVDLSSLTGSGTLRFNYTRTSTGYTSDIALDRINVTGGGSGDEFAWVEGSGWNVNVSVPDFADSLKDLFINISYSSTNFNSTETGAISYGVAPPAWMGWSQNQTNSTVAGENILFSVFWNSSSNLSSYIFGWWNGENWTQTNYSGDKESGEQTFSGEAGAGTDYTEQNCSGYWGFDCGVTCNTPEGDNTHDACASCIGGAADEHVDQVVINGTVFAQNDAVNITCTFDPYSASTELYMWVKYPNGTWIDIGPGDLAPPDGNIISYSRTFTNTANEGQYWARCIADWDGTGASCESGNYIDHDDLPFNVTAGGGGGDDVDANKTAVEYLNVFSGNVYEQIDNLTIISYVSYYNTSGSINNGNANATLWLEVYNGSDWIDEGDFSVTGTGNFSKVITTTSILAAWQTDANRDIKISARLMDYNSSSLYDTINWTEVWINIFSEGDFLKNDSVVEFSGLTNHSNVTKQITSTVGATIKWQIWANDTGSQTNITEIFQFTTTSGAPDTCTCPGAGNNWEVDMEDTCTLSTSCTLTTGNLSWIGSSGSFTCNAQLNLTNRDAPPSNTIFYWSSGCEVNRLIILLLLTSATVFKRKRRLNLI